MIWVRYQLTAPLLPGDVVIVTFAAAGRWTYTLLDGTRTRRTTTGGSRRAVIPRRRRAPPVSPNAR